MIKNFYLSKYTIKIQPETELHLPYYKGSTFRGGFGYIFKKICCVQRANSCNKCLLNEKCVYSYIFESSPKKDSEKLKNIDDIPRPFVIEPPSGNKTNFSPDEELMFGLILFGKATEYLPYMIYTFIELGKNGIGKGRGQFKLKEVTDEKDKIIYDGQSETFKNEDSLVEIPSVNAKGIKTLKVSFLTPTRIKYEGHYTDVPEFHIIIRALLRRISSLMYFYCGIGLEIDFQGLISLSKNVIIQEKNLNWIDWERYSSRQDTRMKLGGFVGDIVYEGDFTPFWQFLTLGEYTHIGKNCTFGLGKYEINRG